MPVRDEVPGAAKLHQPAAGDAVRERALGGRSHDPVMAADDHGRRHHDRVEPGLEQVALAQERPLLPREARPCARAPAVDRGDDGTVDESPQRVRRRAHARHAERARERNREQVIEQADGAVDAGRSDQHECAGAQRPLGHCERDPGAERVADDRRTERRAILEEAPEQARVLEQTDRFSAALTVARTVDREHPVITRRGAGSDATSRPGFRAGRGRAGSGGRTPRPSPRATYRFPSSRQGRRPLAADARAARDPQRAFRRRVGGRAPSGRSCPAPVRGLAGTPRTGWRATDGSRR